MAPLTQTRLANENSSAPSGSNLDVLIEDNSLIKFFDDDPIELIRAQQWPSYFNGVHADLIT